MSGCTSRCTVGRTASGNAGGGLSLFSAMDTTGASANPEAKRNQQDRYRWFIGQLQAIDFGSSFAHHHREMVCVQGIRDGNQPGTEFVDSRSTCV
jgi:hypothetical protein